MRGLGRALARLRYSPRDFARRLFAPQLQAADELPDQDFVRFMRGKMPDPAAPAGIAAPVFLLVSLMPIPYCFKLEGMFARAMQARGYRVVVVTNLACHASALAFHRGLNDFEVVLLEDYLAFRNSNAARRSLAGLLDEDAGRIERVKAFTYREARVGLHALATLSAAMTDGRIRLDRRNAGRLRRLLLRSMLLVDASHELLREMSPALILGMEKGFVGTAEVFYAALERKVDYVQWTACHEPDSIMFKRYRWPNFRDHPFAISSKGWQGILAMRWDDWYTAEVMQQFDAGYRKGSWFKYKNLAGDQTQAERAELVDRFALDPARKTAVIYSHILNDANLFYGDDLFAAGYEQWLVETVRAAAENPHVNWVLKLHPANVYRAAKTGYAGEFGELLALKNAFGAIPEFLRIVYPDEKTSPLSFFRISDYGLTVRGTVGVELPCMGIPVLTAGTGRYAGKGFTIDASTVPEYLDRVRNIHLTAPLSRDQVRLATLHAHFAFKARPARYGLMFHDVYHFSMSDSRYRDVDLRETSIEAVLAHPQMRKIVDFLCSDAEDFLDLAQHAAPEVAAP